MMTESHNTIKIWDPVVRVGHWTLVAGFFTSYLTEDALQSVHVWAGYLVTCLLVIRVTWGVVGTKYARFSDFVRSPRAVTAYLGDVFRGHPQRFLGHNPAGGAMILALLLSLGITVYSGMKFYAIDKNAGPLAAIQPPESITLHLVRVVSSDAEHDDGYREDEGSKEFWEELHEIFANLSLALVFTHVGGVLLASWQHRENLVKAMITGRKRSL